jgi:hypothetical protein
MPMAQWLPNSNAREGLINVDRLLERTVLNSDIVVHG